VYAIDGSPSMIFVCARRTKCGRAVDAEWRPEHDRAIRFRNAAFF
jgi:hypothetical protein